MHDPLQWRLRRGAPRREEVVGLEVSERPKNAEKMGGLRGDAFNRSLDLGKTLLRRESDCVCLENDRHSSEGQQSLFWHQNLWSGYHEKILWLDKEPLFGGLKCSRYGIILESTCTTTALHQTLQ